MKLPASVRVGFKDYSVAPYPKGAQEESGNWGRTKHAGGEIWVHDTPDTREAANTLIHEILHACFHVGGLDYPNNEEEAIVNTLANQLSGVFRDNPDLIRWLLRATK